MATRPSQPSETTRYLCAAAYLDRRFAEHVITKVLQEEHRAVAPSYGVDIVPVVRHCLTAQRRRQIRDAVLTGLLLVGGPLLLLVGVSPPGAGLRLALLAWSVIFVESCSTRYELLAARLLRDRFHPNAAQAPLTRRHARLIWELQQNERGNVTVYSGFSPFVGCGLDQGGWSFALNVDKGRRELHETLEPKPFEVEELHDEVVSSLHALDMDQVRIEDRLYVNGQDIRDDRRFLPDPFTRPSARTDPAVLHRFLRSPTQRVRHYTCIQVVDWQGELVLSIFFRCTKVGANLFVEASYFLLPPLREDYHKVDNLRATPDLGGAAELALEATVGTVPMLLLAPVHVLGRLMSRLTRWLDRLSMRRTIKANPSFDYGATTSIRQSGMSPSYRRYFQRLDREMYVKIVEQRLLDAIIQFLDEHDVDVSDLVERQTTILNNGVMLSGGSIQAESLAVGTGARARAGEVVKTMAKAVPTPPRPGARP
ncbi:MAG TPA: hypothetical protein VFA46_10035 [Actinomycetes bacterium]|jgi:hypothetical protein|nr:hypothetical protein [Actinomycetes bacterium]